MGPDKSLAEILAHRMRVGEPIPVAVALAILRQVCDSLAYAHDLRDPAGQWLGIVHRNLTPAHILVAETGQVTVVPSTSQHGTYAYMAPEYVTTGMSDARADLFSLGVVAHEMLSNRPLFATGDDRETVDRVCALPIPPPSTLNRYVAPELDGIVLGALARDPAYRWQHAAMMRDGIRAAAQRLGLDIEAVPGAVWIEVLAVRPQPAPPQPAAPLQPEQTPQPPPSDPGMWSDDGDGATRIQPFDPSLLDAPLPSPAAPIAPVEPAPIAVAPAPAQTPAPSPPRNPAPIAPAPAWTPAADWAPPPPLAPAPMDPAPMAPQVDLAPEGPAPPWTPPAPRPVATPRPTPAAPARVVPTPTPAAPARVVPTPAPAPVAPVPPPAPPPTNEFDPDLGPEPTQIGAMPLISFGDAPMDGLLGENAQRAPARAPQSPGATFLPDAGETSPERAKRVRIVAIIAVLVVAAVVVIVLAAR